MKTSFTSLAGILLACSCIQPACAELSIFTNAPWLGHFAVFNVSRTQIRVTGQGEITFAHSTEKSELSSTAAQTIQIFVEETLPDGKKVERPVDPSSMESTQGPAENPDNLFIKAKAEGGVVLEILIEQKRNMVFFSGRVLDPGSLAQNPLCIAIRLPFPTSHVKPEPSVDKKESRREIRDNEKAFAKSVSSNSIKLKRSDGKLQKLSFERNLNEVPDYFKGPGIAEVEIESGFFGGTGFLLSATPNSSISFSNATNTPLYQGFTMIWRADTAKDPETKARLGMRMK
jgi:hypothetical protein